MEGLQNTFAPVEAPVESSAKEEKKEMLKGLKADLQQKIATDPDYVSRLKTLSDCIEVTHTLGYGTSGNIVLDKATSTPDKREVKSTSAIVGYEVRNTGTESITYETEVWEQDAEGKYVAHKVEKTLAPGETAALTRKFMTILCSRPEISFTLANGKIISKMGKNRSVEDLLVSFYFQFNDGTPVNDDRVKKAVDEDINGQRVVKAEYIDAFGYLNNPKEKAAKRSKATKVSVQDMMANYVATLLQQ